MGKKEIILKRRTTGYDRKVISITGLLGDILDKLMVNRKIKKFTDNGEITIQRYGKSDLIYDLVFIYGVIAKSLKEDPELKNEYPYKNFKPYYIVKYFVKNGLFPEGYEGGDIEVDEDD